MKHIVRTGWAAVNITSDELVIVSLKSADNLTCLYFENTDQLADAVRKRQLRVKHWVISVPDSLCIRKTVELPATSLDQAYKMLEFELSTYLPLPAEELVYGCMPVSRDETVLTVLVYILKVKTLSNLLARFNSAAITPAKVMVESMAVGSWFGRDSGNIAGQIDILAAKESLFLFAGEDGALQRHEDIPLPNGDLENQRECVIRAVNRLTTERSRDRQPVLRIAADSDIQSEIKGWFETDFETMEFLEPPGLASFAGRILPERDYVFESVVTQGLLGALDPRLRFLNLLGKQALKRAQRKRFITNAAVTFALALFTVVCLWLNFAVMNWRMQHVVQKITEEIAPIKHIAADVESKRQKVKAIQAQLSNRDQISEVFSHLYKYSAKQISISQMSYSSQTAASASLNIKGQADTLSRAFEYPNAMKRSEILNNMQIINAQQIPRPGGSIVEFQAECALQGN